MNLRTPLSPLLFAALTAGGSWAGDGSAPPPPAAPAETPASAKQDYDAIFSDMLNSLPQEKRALVDSAHGAKGNGAQAAKPENPGNGKKPTEEEKEQARQAAKAKRAEAIQGLPPEVRARVDKAITDLDNRRKEKQAEFKDLDK